MRLRAWKPSASTATVALPLVPYVPEPFGLGVPDALPNTITVSLRLRPEPAIVTCGLFAGTRTLSRYVPGATEMTTREGLFAGTASTAFCTLVNCAPPPLATVSVRAPATGAAPPDDAPAAAVPMVLLGPAPVLSSAGTASARSSVHAYDALGSNAGPPPLSLRPLVPGDVRLHGEVVMYLP